MHSFTKAEFYKAKRKNNTIYNGKSWREGEAGAQLRLHKAPPVAVKIIALFIRLIIRLFQLVFSAGTVFFSHNKSANSVF
jgi:hypothetical protein